jgi:putative NADH-flavin reductase
MNLFLLGATGRTGRHVLDQALARGHGVTALVRDPSALEARENLRTRRGDPRRTDDLASVLVGHDAVISCLGQRSLSDATLLREAAAAALEALRRVGVHRYVVVSQGLLFSSRNPIILLLRLILARHVADSAAMERIICTNDVDWTIVRPPRLLDGGAAKGYRIETGAQPRGRWSMQRADLAAYLLDEAEERKSPRAIVGITSN